MGLIVLSVFKQNFVHVGAGVLEQFISAVEDDEGDLTVAQNTQLVGLLHKSKLPLCKRNLINKRTRRGLHWDRFDTSRSMT